MIHMTADHIAHCGMNCSLCVAFQMYLSTEKWSTDSVEKWSTM